MESEIARMVQDYDRGRLSRRQLIAHVAGLAAAVAAMPRSARAQAEPNTTFTGTDLNHIALRVTDIGRSRAFYEQHLGLTVSSQGRTNCFMRCKEKNFVALFKADTPAMDHYCYSVRNFDPGEAVERLTAQGLKPRRVQDRVYFDDPDGLEVQVAAKSHGV